jgi:TonB family protein
MKLYPKYFISLLAVNIICGMAQAADPVICPLPSEECHSAISHAPMRLEVGKSNGGNNSTLFNTQMLNSEKNSGTVTGVTKTTDRVINPSLTNTSHSQPKATQKLIAQKKSNQKMVTNSKVSPPSGKIRLKLTREILERQIAQMGAKIRYATQNTRIKFVHTVSRHKYVAAQYIKNWENKIERTGNLNYPRVAIKEGSFASLTMDVGIQANGDIYSIRVSKSSGTKALDDAAKRIVHLSAPFSALPKELLEEVDVLVIRRKWKFPDIRSLTIK